MTPPPDERAGARMATEEWERLRIAHQRLRARMSRSWNAFFARFGSLRPVQLDGMPVILDGKNVLITAPTAGGKTEATVAPIVERILQERWEGLSALLITPTRALVNDLFERLRHPCSTLRISLARKTSDHALSGTADAQLLITTPESTESLLTFNRERLQNIRAIIIDEVHLLDGTPRGDQLRVVIQRLQTYLEFTHQAKFRGIQRVAMSATIAHPQRLAGTFLGPIHQIVSVPGQRQIEASVIVQDGDDGTRAIAAVEALGPFPDIRKMLVFVNSRKQVDVSAPAFRHGPLERFSVYGHHGSLSKYERERTEERFQQDERAICVATMTLEVGIDIGDIDLVVCLDPPFSLASFLQRIGRGCRRLQGLTRVLCVARDRQGELMFNALIRQGTLGMPSTALVPFRRSVLVQQVLAYLRQVPGHQRTIEQMRRVLVDDMSPHIPAEWVDQVLHDLAQNGMLDRRGTVFQPASKGWEFIQSSRIYSNMAGDFGGTSIVDADTGRAIANVAEIQAHQAGINIAGRTYTVVSQSRHGVQVRIGDEGGGSPKYFTRRLPYAPDVGASLAGLLGIHDNEIVAIASDEGVLVFSWLGQLLNEALAHGIQRIGHRASGERFHIRVTPAPSDAADLFHRAVDSVLDQNPLPNAKVERLVDLGPYIEQLSTETQARAKADWLDADFLRTWSCRKKHVRQVERDSQLGLDLLALV